MGAAGTDTESVVNVSNKYPVSAIDMTRVTGQRQKRKINLWQVKFFCGSLPKIHECVGNTSAASTDDTDTCGDGRIIDQLSLLHKNTSIIPDLLHSVHNLLQLK